MGFLIQDPQLFLRRHRPSEKRRCVAVLIGFSQDIAANLPTRATPPAPSFAKTFDPFLSHAWINRVFPPPTITALFAIFEQALFLATRSYGTFECQPNGPLLPGREGVLRVTRFSPISSHCLELSLFLAWNDTATCNYVTFRRVIFSRSTFD